MCPSFKKKQNDLRWLMTTSAFAFLAVFVLLFASCAKKADEALADSDMTLIVEQERQEEPVTVSPCAKEYFLEPLRKFSWEKKFDTEYVVLHFTSNVVADRENPYDMQAIRRIFEDNELSVHYIIDRDGNAYCYIPENRAAWHAGVGTFGDDEKYTNKMNKYSIGIEIAAIGSKADMAQYLESYEYYALDSSLVGFSDAQYETLKKLVPDICERNGIPFDREHVIGHEQYNENKTDPGELFDWARLFE